MSGHGSCVEWVTDMGKGCRDAGTHGMGEYRCV